MTAQARSVAQNRGELRASAQQNQGRGVQEPVGRDPVLDLVRAAALLVVVMWHWAFTTLRWSDGPHVGNPIGRTPGSWLVTWFLQVMPLFFLVGGTLHAAALERHLAAGHTARSFIAARFRRLVIPVLPLLAVAGAVAGGAIALGRTDVARGVVLMITPLWFLAVYLVLVVVAPFARLLHQRHGLWAIGAATAVVAVVDRAITLPSHGDVGMVTTLAIYVLTWSVVHQLGFHLHQLRSAPRVVPWTTCGGGFAALVVGASALGYPASMVGTHPEPISNMSPPNLMVVFLAVAQMGLLVVADAPLRRWCERHNGLLGTAGEWSMTIYVWHMLALAAFWGLITMVVGTPAHHVNGAWWAQRPVWLVGPLLFAVPLFALMGPGRGQGREQGRTPHRTHDRPPHVTTPLVLLRRTAENSALLRNRTGRCSRTGRRDGRTGVESSGAPHRQRSGPP